MSLGQAHVRCRRESAAACGTSMDERPRADNDSTERSGSRPSEPAAEESIPSEFAAKLLDRHGEKPGVPLPMRLGKYELEEEISRGGMGIVYRAREEGLERRVAVKMVLSGEFASADELRRFEIEARTVATLDHPHIVPLYETGQLEGRPYLAMKLLEGGSLLDRLGEFESARAAAALVESLARAVHHAHRRGVLHRDLKPENILFDQQDRPYISDFGLARRLDAQSRLTGSGALVGTLRYMAPELAEGTGSPATTAVDIYGLGTLLYELITGRPPFTAESSSALIMQILKHDPPPPSTVTTSVRRDMDAICMKCLEKSPTARYASAGALAGRSSTVPRG